LNAVEFVFGFIGLVIVWFLFGLIGLVFLALIIALAYGVSNRSKQKQHEDTKLEKGSIAERMILDHDYIDRMIQRGYVYNIEKGIWEKDD